MIALTISIFLVEFGIGFGFWWLDVVTISIFTLKTVIPYCITIFSVWLGMQPADFKYKQILCTFGWSRTDVLGAVLNSVILLAWLLIGFFEALQAFVEPRPIDEPLRQCIISGGVKMVLNLIGIILFFHDGSDFMRKEMPIRELLVSSLFLHCVTGLLLAAGRTLSSGLFHGYHKLNMFRWGANESITYDVLSVQTCLSAFEEFKIDHIFRNDILPNHIDGSAERANRTLASLADEHWTFYMQPTMNFLISIIMIAVVLKFVKIPLLIAIQVVPHSFKYEAFRRQLTRLTEGTIKHVHVWNHGDMYVGSMTLLCKSLTQFLHEAAKIKKLACSYKLHTLTIQPLFPSQLRACGDDRTCKDHTFDDVGACKHHKYDQSGTDDPVLDDQGLDDQERLDSVSSAISHTHSANSINSVS